MNIPKELKYTKDHEWVKIDGDIATIGISEFATKELGDIVFIEVETVGEKLIKGDAFGNIEAVKTVSEIFMPISGEVIEFNENLEDTPEIINKNAYEDGWIIKVKMSDTSQLDDLHCHNDYSDLIG